MKKYLAAILLTACTFCTASATAQTKPEPSLQTLATHELQRSNKRNKFVTLSHENDMLGGGTDRNYTSGVRLTYFDLGMELPEFAKTIDSITPTFSINETTSVYYSIGHNLYTPRDIQNPVQDPNDRPWAAFLYVSAGLYSITNNHTDNVEVTLGVVGPMAMGEPIQKFIHKHISDSPAPKGWDNQLKNEPGIMLSWERRWPERFAFKTMGWTTSAVPHAGITVGNIYTYANAGVSISLSPFEGRFQDTPIRVRPAMPGTGAFIVPDKSFSWYLFGGIDGRAVARNIFLDGNTFRDSHSIDKRTFTADVTGGFALTYGNARLSYALVYRTPEFYAQDDGDVFGTVSLGFRF